MDRKGPIQDRAGQGPPIEVEETSLSGFVRSIASSLADLIRANRLSAILAALAVAIVLPLTMGEGYDERPRYRQYILPQIERLEERYLTALELAESAPNRTWRLYHFLRAHETAVELVHHARSRRTMTDEGARAHAELVRYYALVDTHFAIVRTELSLRPEMDFLKRWAEVEAEIQPVYERWSSWLDAGPAAESP